MFDPLAYPERLENLIKIHEGNGTPEENWYFKDPSRKAELQTMTLKIFDSIAKVLEGSPNYRGGAILSIATQDRLLKTQDEFLQTIVLESLLHDYNWTTLAGKEVLKPKITALLESGAPLTDKRKEKLQYVKDDEFLLGIRSSNNRQSLC